MGGGSEFAAEGEEDIVAYQVDLFVDGPLGYAPKVEAEELPAVVAEVARKARDLLDDFGRAADGETGGLGGGFRVASGVRRRVVEVGGALAAGVLGVAPDEDCPAGADDRLVGAAMAVVLVALAVARRTAGSTTSS